MDFKYEMVVPNEDLPCKFFIFEGKNGNYRRANHWHQSVEIFLVLEGELKFYINNQSQPLSAGELIIVNSNEIHSIEAPNPSHCYYGKMEKWIPREERHRVYCMLWCLTSEK